MKHLRRNVILGLFLVLIGFAPTFAQEVKPTEDLKNKYLSIEVVKFEIEPEVKFPAESRDVVMAQIFQELVNLKRFKKVTNVGETVSPEDAPSVRLTGTITKYEAGSRAKRYFIGFGAGATKVTAHIKFTDIATGNVVFEKDLTGKVWIGLFGGDSSSASKGLSKDVGKITKKLFFKG